MSVCIAFGGESALTISVDIVRTRSHRTARRGGYNLKNKTGQSLRDREQMVVQTETGRLKPSSREMSK